MPATRTPAVLRPLLAALLIALAGPALAADTPEPATPRDPLAEARQQIAQRQWPAALRSLRRVNDTRSADWNNLMGYTLRKSTPPDLAASERHYLEALKINPRHLGALEYIGELHLMQGDLGQAEQRLAALATACASNCEEYKDLKREIERFKANGNRFVAQP
jgi:Flp pilus assembly protein TadD